mmetsp:Transcript_23488/g.63695  ORF Transcript_23488/g.63695 Transcript_23488/m.63695 type:complete len:256 (+) Transcript_23488:203-970(+)
MATLMMRPRCRHRPKKRLCHHRRQTLACLARHIYHGRMELRGGEWEHLATNRPPSVDEPGRAALPACRTHPCAHRTPGACWSRAHCRSRRRTGRQLWSRARTTACTCWLSCRCSTTCRSARRGCRPPSGKLRVGTPACTPHPPRCGRRPAFCPRGRAWRGSAAAPSAQKASNLHACCSRRRTRSRDSRRRAPHLYSSGPARLGCDPALLGECASSAQSENGDQADGFAAEMTGSWAVATARHAPCERHAMNGSEQ